MTLFFLPHAGGSAKSYCNWKRYLPADWRIVPMEPAGRGYRVEEPFFQTIPACAADLLERHKADFTAPYILFGHSMGATLATELTRQIGLAGLPNPQHVFLSGRCTTEETCNAFPDFAERSDDAILTFFQQQGLFFKKTAENAGLWEMFARILCADVRMTESYALSPNDFQFPCGIHVLYGKEDPFLQNCDMTRWAAYTQADCRIIAYPGDHFYCNAQKAALCQEMLAAVETEKN